MQKLDGKTMDIVGDNIDKLKEIFPDVFSEGKIDFEALKANLGEAVETEQERYSFNWNGKQEAKLIAQTPSTGTLRPCKEDSKDWDTTENLYIEGDNLEVLKLLQKSYHNKVKMIYIDPPYNTGKDFVYKDNFKDNIQNYKKVTGQIDEDGNKLSTNSDQSGRYHSNWLNMMYPRLKLARNLLKDDGVIIIHIDEHEYSNLEKLCQEIFGEDNNLGTIIWDKRNPKGDAKGIAYQNESILIFSKNIDILTSKYEIKRKKKNAELMMKKSKQLFNKFKDKVINFEKMNDEFRKFINLNTNLSGGERAYNKIDKNGIVYQPVSMAWPNNKKAPDDYFIKLIHPITKKSCPIPDKGWRNPSKTMEELLKKDLIVFGNDETTQPRRKYLLQENMYENLPSLYYFGGSDDKLFKELDLTFDNPKPVSLVKDLLETFVMKDEIILDFFSGSSSTAHATVELNSEDNGNRKFIMVQLPEKTKNDEYPTICHIAKERIRKAGDKIVENNYDKDISNLDTGFKVFKLDSSNIKEWDSEYAKDNITQSLFDHVDNIKSDRTEEDILFELLLKHGLDLTTPIDEIEIEEKKIFNIGAGTLYICLASGVNNNIAERILEEHKLLESPRVSVIFKDTGFINDIEKTNVIQTLKVAGITDVKSV